MVIWSSHFKQQPWRETLAIKAVAGPVVGFWLLVVCGYMVISMLVSVILDIQPGDMMASVAGSRHLGLFLVVVFLAPVVEEFVFRGYLFRAWRYTKLGLRGTLVLTSELFALLHGAQYPAFLGSLNISRRKAFSGSVDRGAGPLMNMSFLALKMINGFQVFQNGIYSCLFYTQIFQIRRIISHPIQKPAQIRCNRPRQCNPGIS